MLRIMRSLTFISLHVPSIDNLVLAYKKMMSFFTLSSARFASCWRKIEIKLLKQSYLLIEFLATLTLLGFDRKIISTVFLTSFHYLPIILSSSSNCLMCFWSNRLNPKPSTASSTSLKVWFHYSRKWATEMYLYPSTKMRVRFWVYFQKLETYYWAGSRYKVWWVLRG